MQRSSWVTPPGPVAPGLTIGLLGGSFDPAHGGHLYVSLVALKSLGLDYVWWLVSPGNPLKGAPAALADRLAQARAVARHPRIRVSDIEERLGTRFTIDTIAALMRRFPQVHFVWLMGSDNLQQFARWRRWPAIVRRLPVVVVRRPGSVLASLNALPVCRFGLATRPVPAAILVLDGHRNFESSTALRQAGLGGAANAMLNPLL